MRFVTQSQAEERFQKQFFGRKLPLRPVVPLSSFRLLDHTRSRCTNCCLSAVKPLPGQLNLASSVAACVGLVKHLSQRSDLCADLAWLGRAGSIRAAWSFWTTGIESLRIYFNGADVSPQNTLFPARGGCSLAHFPGWSSGPRIVYELSSAYEYTLIPKLGAKVIGPEGGIHPDGPPPTPPATPLGPTLGTTSRACRSRGGSGPTCPSGGGSGGLRPPRPTLGRP